MLHYLLVIRHNGGLRSIHTKKQNTKKLTDADVSVLVLVTEFTEPSHEIPAARLHVFPTTYLTKHIDFVKATGLIYCVQAKVKVPEVIQCHLGGGGSKVTV